MNLRSRDEPLTPNRKTVAGARWRAPDLMVMADEPTPNLLVELDEELQRLMQSLRDDTLRRISLKRLEGYSNEEIAQDEGITVRSVERKMQLVRKTWLQLAEA